MVFSRRLSHADGGFAGIAAAGVQLAYFQDLFGRLNLGAHGAAMLLRTDGVVLAHWPETAGQVGRDISADPVFQPMQQAAAGLAEEVGDDGVERAFAYHRVNDLPLIVAVGFGRDEILAPWVRKTAETAAVLTVLGGLAAVLAFALRRELRQRARAEQAARHAIADAERSARDAEALARQVERAGQDLAQALAAQEALVQNSSDALFAVRVGDGGERFTYESINPRGVALTGVSARVMIGRTPQECLPPQAAESVLSRWRECARDGRTLHYCHTLELPGGRRDWETFVAPVFDGDGRVCRLVGSARDVTERNRLEADLRLAQRMNVAERITADALPGCANLQ